MKLKHAAGSALLAIVVLNGCGNGAEAPIRVGLLVWPPYELPYLARELGYYEDLNLELVEFHSPAEAVRAYDTNGIDMVAITIDYLVQLGANDPAHRAVMVINISDGADAVLANPDIESLQDLRGRRVGVERSALGTYMYTRMLEHAGLGPDDVTAVPVDVPESPGAYENGEVDAVVTYEPYRTRILETGAVELFSSRDIPGEIVDVMVTREAVIENHAERIRGLIEGWLRAGEYLEDEPARAAAVLARRERISPDQYLDALEHIRLADREVNRHMLGSPKPELLASLKRTEAVLRAQSIVRKPVAVEKLIDARFFESPGD